jgi:hypothetical protein
MLPPTYDPLASASLVSGITDHMALSLASDNFYHICSNNRGKEGILFFILITTIFHIFAISSRLRKMIFVYSFCIFFFFT